MPKFAHLGSKFSKSNVRFEIRNFEIEHKQNFAKILASWYFFVQNTQIWIFGLEVWETKAGRKFQISPVLKIWVVLCRFANFWGSFELVLGRLGWFQAGVGSFWHVPDFSKYGDYLGFGKARFY